MRATSILLSAAIAQENLQPAAAKEVARSLEQEPGATLMDVGYITKLKDTLTQRLHAAGPRLSALLNKVLQP